MHVCMYVSCLVAVFELSGLLFVTDDALVAAVTVEIVVVVAAAAAAAVL